MLPRNKKELQDQLDRFRTVVEQYEYLTVLKLKFRELLKAKPREPDTFMGETVEDWKQRRAQRLQMLKHTHRRLLSMRREHADELVPQPGFPLVWNSDDFNYHKEEIRQSGKLKAWVSWLLSELDEKNRDSENWEFSKRAIRQGRMYLKDHGKSDTAIDDMHWNYLNVSGDFVDYLKLQKENLPEELKTGSCQSSKSVSKKRDADALDKLLKEILDRTENEPNSRIWSYLKQELERKKRKYDRTGILKDFIEQPKLKGLPHGTIYWQSKGKRGKLRLMFRTLENRLSAIRKEKINFPLTE